jgi:hypothetical protein
MSVTEILDEVLKRVYTIVSHHELQEKCITTKIYGREWGAQPTDEELGLSKDEDELNSDEGGDYYTQVYGVVPIEWRDTDGNLIGMVYKSNSDETRRLWGDSLTVRMDEEEEYSDGEAIDDRNERQYYFH